MCMVIYFEWVWESILNFYGNPLQKLVREYNLKQEKKKTM